MKSLKEYIIDAGNRKVAIGHFNISNIEGMWGVFNAAKSLDLPVIIGASEGERDFIGVPQVAALIKSLREEYKYPVFLNADHTYSFDRVKQAIDAGFDSVIFDGAQHSFEDNVAETKKCVEYARASGKDVLVEGELGYIGVSSKILDAIPEGVTTSGEGLTKPEVAADFVKQTGVDLLAPAVGNVHGMMRVGHDPRLDIKRIAEIREAAGIPLVLHGGSGTVDEDFVSAIKAGMAIVHISTELRVAYRKALELVLQQNPDEVAPYKYLKEGLKAIQATAAGRLKLFNDIA
jgi:fructose-bisphosphate aldolase class II